MRRKGGRPTKLTPEVRERIVRAIAAGSYYAAAAQLAGITPRTFYNWMKRGREELERVESTPRARIRERERPYVEFYKAVKQAEAEAEIKVVARWWESMKDDWRACRDFLARRFPERWAPKVRQEVTGAEGKPLEMSIKGYVTISPDDWDEEGDADG